MDLVLDILSFYLWVDKHVRLHWIKMRFFVVGFPSIAEASVRWGWKWNRHFMHFMQLINSLKYNAS